MFNWEIIFILWGVVLLYFLPWIVSLCGRKRNSLAILMLVTFLGWTVIGWVVALIWACMSEERERERKKDRNW